MHLLKFCAATEVIFQLGRPRITEGGSGRQTIGYATAIAVPFNVTVESYQCTRNPAATRMFIVLC